MRPSLPPRRGRPAPSGRLRPAVAVRTADLGRGLHEIGPIPRQPVDAWVAAEPGTLAAGELAGRRHRQLARLLLRQLAVEVSQNLAVPERARGGETFPETRRGLGQ